MTRVKYREVTTNPEYLQFGDLRLDPKRQRVWRNGQSVDLPGLSFRLLEVLLRAAPRVVSRSEMRREVWGGIVVSDDALRQRVRLLRQALGGESYVSTVKGIGYRLALPVVEVSVALRSRRLRLLAATVALALASLALLASGLVPEVKHAILHTLRH